MWHSMIRCGVRTSSSLIRGGLHQVTPYQRIGGGLMMTRFGCDNFIGSKLFSSVSNNNGFDRFKDNKAIQEFEKLEQELMDELQSVEAEYDQFWDNLHKSMKPGEDENAEVNPWLAKPKPVYLRKVDPHGRAYGRGTRKESLACVWIKPGSGSILVNNKLLSDYFTSDVSKIHAIEPLVATKTIGTFDVRIITRGGGFTGQSGAIRMGLARALQNWDPEYRAVLKPLKMLTRDMRMVERKKPGQKKARKKFQWVKR